MTGFYDDGSHPLGQVFRDSVGNIYGTDSVGGDGFGTVFKINYEAGPSRSFTASRICRTGENTWAGLLS